MINHYLVEERAIIIFVRHAELGKVKTRLAATIGNEKALAIYKLLLMHTYKLIEKNQSIAYVYYAENIIQDDLWKGANVKKKLQVGNDLGGKMANAFQEVLKEGHNKVVIIGSDCYDLTVDLIDHAFEMLGRSEIVIGPAKDGGYYLLGMNAPFKNLFENIEWSTHTVFSKTIDKINQNKYSFSTLPILADVDTEEDITFSY